MWAIVAIRAAFKWLFQIFLDAALWCYESPLNLDWLGDIFADAYFAFSDIWYELRELALWFESLEERLTDVITESRIFQLLQKWLNYAEDAWSWVLNSVQYVGSIIDDWWSPIWSDVKGYIAIAVEGLAELRTAWDTFWHVTWPELVNRLENLYGSWDLFVTTVLNTLVSFTWLTTWWQSRLTDIDALINSWFIAFTPFWEGWQEIRDQVLEFFADPLTWLEQRFTDWFLGAE